MSKNQGHARCNAFGIKYLSENSDFDYLILMDGDGEDRPEEIKSLVKKILLEPNKSVVAKRIKRSEGPLFKMLYIFHKYLTLLMTGKLIDFGNYSCLTKTDLKILSNKASLWSSYSGTLKKNIPLLNSINSERGSRYYGPSKMSLFKLIVHSFSMIAVFKYSVFLRSTFLLIAASYFSYKFNFLVSVIQILLVIFSLIIYFVSLRGNKDELLKSFSNKDSSTTYTH
jgi:glycosyltransferase involved in cell wall biosynthesis